MPYRSICSRLASRWSSTSRVVPSSTPAVRIIAMNSPWLMLSERVRPPASTNSPTPAWTALANRAASVPARNPPPASRSRISAPSWFAMFDPAAWSRRLASSWTIWSALKAPKAVWAACPCAR